MDRDKKHQDNLILPTFYRYYCEKRSLESGKFLFFVALAMGETEEVTKNGQYCISL